MSAIFSVVIVTAPPPGLAGEAGGAFVKVDGRESVLRCVEMFLNRDNIKQIQLVVPQANAEEAKKKFGAHLGFSGVKMTVSGATWNEQIAALAGSISDQATHVIIHDGARPSVAYSDIDALLDEAVKKTVVALACPLKNAILELDEGHNPVAQHSPERYLMLQTPIAMTKARFIELAKSKKDIHASEYSIIRTSPFNVRVGNSGDEKLVKAMMNLLPRPKSKASNNPFEEAQW